MHRARRRLGVTPERGVCAGVYVAAVRLIVARCSVEYSGRLSTRLPEALRLLMVKSDGTFMVWADNGAIRSSR